MVIDGFRLHDGDVCVEFDPAAVLKELAPLYDIRLSSEGDYQSYKDLLSIIIEEATHVCLSTNQLGGIFDLYRVKKELPRAVLMRWYTHRKATRQKCKEVANTAN